jgi:ABC-type transport system involved in multi-copper enzyme maturation permease subunit
MIKQTLALLLDAYRDLNSRRMFWIVLILSSLVALSFASLGLTRTGFEIFWWKIDSFYMNSRVLSPGDFYKTLFLTYGINFWLTWLATVLAIISTASIFPDFIAAGAIDLYLSKPIGRWRLFFTKYACGLLFVALQIACFCAASFLVIGIRGSAWEPGIFLAVPIVVLFFSYLFCFCTLIGVWTRSTVAAVLLTLLFWVGLFAVHTTETLLLTLKLTDEAAAHRIDSEIAKTQKTIDDLRAQAATRPSAQLTDRLKAYQSQLQNQQSTRAEHHDSFARPHQLFYEVKTLLPKTAETVALLDRQLISRAGLQNVASAQEQSGQEPSNANQVDLNGNPVPVEELRKELASRTIGWVIGTSVTFEVVILLFSGWLFARRDY